MGTPWTDENKAALRRMLAEGKTFTEIGAVLGCTRNPAIGQAHRMGIQTRRKGLAPMVRITKVETRRTPFAPRVETPSQPLRFGPMPVIEMPAIIPMPSSPPEPGARRAQVTLLDAAFGQCRWITRRDPKRAGRDIICADATLPGRSWCAEHHARCFTRAPKKTQAQMEADERRKFAIMRKSGAARAFA